MSMLRALAALLACGVVLGPLPAQAAERVCRLDPSLDEISGMTVSRLHPDVLWAVEDSGGGPRVVAIDASNCAVRAELTLRGSRARDFEAIAAGTLEDGTSVLWVGDIGDNRDSWPTVELLRIREPKQLRDRTVRPERFTFTYDDRPHDAEALLAHGTRVWVVTKQLANGGLYALPDPLDPDAVNIARRVRSETGLVTDGSIAPDGSRYVLRDYFDAQLFTGLPPGTPAERIDLPAQRQGEVIAFDAEGTAVLIASEGERRLLRVVLPKAAAAPAALPSPGPSSVDGVTDEAGNPVMLAGLLSAGAALVLAAAVWRRRSQRRRGHR